MKTRIAVDLTGYAADLALAMAKQMQTTPTAAVEHLLEDCAERARRTGLAALRAHHEPPSRQRARSKQQAAEELRCLLLAVVEAHRLGLRLANSNAERAALLSLGDDAVRIGCFLANAILHWEVARVIELPKLGADTTVAKLTPRISNAIRPALRRWPHQATAHADEEAGASVVVAMLRELGVRRPDNLFPGKGEGPLDGVPLHERVADRAKQYRPHVRQAREGELRTRRDELRPVGRDAFLRSDPFAEYLVASARRERTEREARLRREQIRRVK